ncbi:hypothetical protein D5086_016777 [Populus alba]|uniref:Uncharacterized protein n=1 Tax=Populus alba TaxID=43335 RepID=A0ACC4BVK7_POPAL
MASTIKFSGPSIDLAFLLLLLMSFLNISLAAYCGSMGGSSGESSPVSSGGGSSFSSGGRGSYSWDYIDSGGSRGQGGGRRGSKVDVIIFVTGVVIVVGLTGTAFSLQNELNEISSTVNTSTARGWHRILTKTVLALLRYPEYMISGFSSVTILVAANGMYKVPAIRSTKASKAVEVLWTPRAENETLSEQGFLQNYPRLRPDFMT